MKKTFLLSCLMLAAMPVMAAYTGHVYVDKNKNGVFDQSEKPLAGIKVSDGLNVVETAADGSFTLPGHERERFIFITTPSGYMEKPLNFDPFGHAELSLFAKI